ncbi:MAG: hypothetical protein IANPNBLG_00690 [Bryobacteraceae bacterium]|nr:hypothetical protein [Bryobacteraceae bacterium]
MNTQATTLYPFVPSGPNFERSLEFYEALGFQQVWRQEGFAGLRFGGAYFILLDIDVPEWQSNQMINFEVENLDAYWTELKSDVVAARFPGVRFLAPTDFPWGREIHIIDPGGVCWHVRESES